MDAEKNNHKNSFIIECCRGLLFLSVSIKFFPAFVQKLTVYAVMIAMAHVYAMCDFLMFIKVDKAISPRRFY